MRLKIGTSKPPAGFEETEDLTLEEKIRLLREMAAKRKTAEKTVMTLEARSAPLLEAAKLLRDFNLNGIATRISRRRK
jgi:hypothetical protein